MQERVTSTNNRDFPDLIVQFSSDLGTLGIGLEPSIDVPSKHMIDQIYGASPYQLSEIGRLFNSAAICRAHELGWNEQDFGTSDEEDEFYAQLGRVILDVVIESQPGANGWWTWLDRPAANRLIRLVRKGRDITFGRDE